MANFFVLVLDFVTERSDTISTNGSADLRSPEKEVYFRSWDFANSQMCEVRVATSNICGCNPPNRCGKRSGADFATSDVLPLCEGGDFFAQNFNRNTAVQILQKS